MMILYQGRIQDFIIRDFWTKIADIFHTDAKKSCIRPCIVRVSFNRTFLRLTILHPAIHKFSLDLYLTYVPVLAKVFCRENLNKISLLPKTKYDLKRRHKRICLINSTQILQHNRTFTFYYTHFNQFVVKTKII